MKKDKPAPAATALRRARLVAIVGAAAMMSTAAWFLEACKAAVSDEGPSNVEGDTNPPPPIEVVPTSGPKTAAPQTTPEPSAGTAQTGTAQASTVDTSSATAHPAPSAPPATARPAPTRSHKGPRKKGPPSKSTIIYE